MHNDRLEEITTIARRNEYSATNVFGVSTVVELVNEIRRRGRMVDELLVGEPHYHHYGQCRWCEHSMYKPHDDDCAWLRAIQARDW